MPMHEEHAVLGDDVANEDEAVIDYEDVPTGDWILFCGHVYICFLMLLFTYREIVASASRASWVVRMSKP